MPFILRHHYETPAHALLAEFILADTRVYGNVLYDTCWIIEFSDRKCCSYIVSINCQSLLQL